MYKAYVVLFYGKGSKLTVIKYECV